MASVPPARSIDSGWAASAVVASSTVVGKRTGIQQTLQTVQTRCCDGSLNLLPTFSQTSPSGARGHDANAKEIGSVDDDFVQTWLGVGVLRIDLFEMVTQNTSDTDVARPLAIRGNDVPRCIVS